MTKKKWSDKKKKMEPEGLLVCKQNPVNGL